MPDGAAPALKTRTYEYATAVLDLSAAMEMSGLDYMKALVAGEIGSRSLFSRGLLPQMTTRRSASANGNDRSRTAFTTLKIAVLAPIPSARFSTATAVTPGFFASTRAP